MTGLRPLLAVLALAAALRLPYLHHAIQGDDAFYLAIAEHALVDPLHPSHFHHVAQGIEVDMRGFPKPPGNGWILAALLAAFGDVNEAAFHTVYLGFTLLAAVAAWRLAQRFCTRPLAGTLLFLATPAFVINGNSLEADVPFVAFWMAAMACWVRAVDEARAARLVGFAVFGAAAALIEYKAVALVPIAALYLWRARRAWRPAWLALLAPIMVMAAWQAFERATTGALPAEVLSGYFQSANLHAWPNKLRNAAALTVHLGWMAAPSWLPGLAFPLLLFWLPFAAGLALLAWCARRCRTDFLHAWIALYFAFALVAFFSGSARYLLPVAAPLAFALVNARPAWAPAAIALQLAIGCALAFSNSQHWAAYRDFVAAHAGQIAAHRTWVAADWGLRFYAESAGAAPLRRGQAVRPGDLVIAGRIGQPIDFVAGGGIAAPVAEAAVTPGLPLRLFGAGSPSTYSTHAHGLRAFDVTTAPADVITMVTIVERKPELSFLPMSAPQADTQLLSGVYPREGDNPWRWTSGRAVALLAKPAVPSSVEATFRLIDQAPARHATLAVDGRVVAELTVPGPGLYTIRSAAPIAVAAASATVTLTFDRTFRAGNDQRDLAAILTAIGFRSARGLPSVP